MDSQLAVKPLERNPAADFYFLIGQDNLPELSTWRRIEDITRLAQFVVFHRGDERVQHPYMTLSRRLEISATEIRQRVASGETIQYLVPPEVARIIHNEQLYAEEQSSNLRT